MARALVFVAVFWLFAAPAWAGAVTVTVNPEATVVGPVITLGGAGDGRGR